MLLIAICAIQASSMASTEPYPKDGRIHPLSRVSGADPALEELMNFPGRVYGDHGFFSELGDWENLYFSGDTDAFNRFLALYGKLTVRPLILTISPGKGHTSGAFGMGSKNALPCDWHYMRRLAGTKRARKLTALPFYRSLIPLYSTEQAPAEPDESVSVEVWTGGGVDVSKIKAPANVTVQRDPRASAEGKLVFDKLRSSRKARLDLIAKAVSGLSRGKSELLIGSEAGANPAAGSVVRAISWGDVPLVAVCAVTRPFSAKLDSLGEGKVFGAVSFLVDAASPGESAKAPPGTYMLFEPNRTPKQTEQDSRLGPKRARPILLVSVNSGNGRTIYTRALLTPARYVSTEESPENRRPSPRLEVGFPSDTVQPGDPAGRAYAVMVWEQDTYFFQLDLEVMLV